MERIRLWSLIGGFLAAPGPSNEELLERYRNADFDGFDVFFRRNQGLILNFLRTRLGDRADAEDAFQETFIRIHKSILSYDSSQKALAWVLTIARNVAVDLVRKRLRRPAGSSDVEVSVAPDQELVLAAREELTRLTSRLTADECALIEGRFLSDESFEAIAEKHGTTAAGTRQKFSRLLRKLKAGSSSPS